MNYGPTPAALRYALNLVLQELNDEIRLGLIEDKDVYLHNSSLVKPTDKSYFAFLHLNFYIHSKNKYIDTTFGLSNKNLPDWLTDENSEIVLYDLRIVREIVEHWVLRNVVFL